MTQQLKNLPANLLSKKIGGRANTRQNKFDQKLIYSLSKSKLPTFKQLKKLPQILEDKEIRVIQFLLIAIFLSSFFLGIRFYAKHIVYLPKKGGDYTEGLLGYPRLINPVLAPANDVDMDISKLVFSSLFKYDKNQKIVPDAAETVKISEDQKTYTVSLKKHILWHDNTPLTSNDVVFTVESIQDPLIKSPLRLSLQGVIAEKLDDYTVRFILEEPYAPFLDNLTFGILPEHIWRNVNANNFHLAEYNLKPIGSGPYKWDELKKDRDGNIKSYNLVFYKNYNGQRPYIMQLNFKFYPNFQSIIEALKNKEVEGINFLPNDLRDRLKKTLNINYYALNLPQYTSIFFNQNNNEFLKDIKLRKALASSINKERVVAESLQGNGRVIHSPILEGFVGFSRKIPKLDFNIYNANDLLDKANYTRIDVNDFVAQKMEALEKDLKDKENLIKTTTGIAGEAEKSEIEKNATSTETILLEIENLKNKKEELNKLKELPFLRKLDDKIVNIKLTTINKPENIAALNVIKNSWQNIGIIVNIKVADEAEIKRDIIKSRNYEALLYSEIIGSDPDPYPFWHSSQIMSPGLNLSLFANKEADRLLEEARQTNDNNIRQEKYILFQKILAEKIPAIFLYNPVYTYVVSNKIHGIDIQKISAPSDRFSNIENWYIKTKIGWK